MPRTRLELFPGLELLVIPAEVEETDNVLEDCHSHPISRQDEEVDFSTMKTSPDLFCNTLTTDNITRTINTTNDNQYHGGNTIPDKDAGKLSMNHTDDHENDARKDSSVFIDTTKDADEKAQCVWVNVRPGNDGTGDRKLSHYLSLVNFTGKIAVHCSQEIAHMFGTQSTSVGSFVKRTDSDDSSPSKIITQTTVSSSYSNCDIPATPSTTGDGFWTESILEQDDDDISSLPMERRTSTDLTSNGNSVVSRNSRDEDSGSQDEESLDGFLPSHLRSHQMSRSTASSRSAQDRKFALSMVGDTTTQLHSLCKNGDVQLEEVLTCLQNDPRQAEACDIAGRLPLHVIGSNKQLLRSPKGRKIAQSIVERLVQIYPKAGLHHDFTGNLPFFSILSEWVTSTLDDSYGARDSSNLLYPKIVRRLSGAGNSTAAAQRGHSSSAFGYAGADKVETPAHLHSFPRVEMWDEVQWCLNMLTLVLQAMMKDKREGWGREGAQRHLSWTERKLKKKGLILGSSNHKPVKRPLIQELVKKIPRLLPTLLLIDDDSEKTRKKILQSPLVQWLILDSDSVGPWIVDMLIHGSTPASRAIDYFWLVSSQKVENLSGSSRVPTERDIAEFHAAKGTVGDAIESLDGVMAAIVTLPTNEIERAASSSTIWHLMNATLARPFVFGLVALDFVLHLVFLKAFRSRGTAAGLQEDEVEHIPVLVINVIGGHFLIRKACEILVHGNLSRTILLDLVTDPGFIFDVATIIFVMVATAQSQRNQGNILNGFNAMVIGCLWIKVLSFLKVINKDLSTFITSLVIILGEIKYFTIVMIVFLIMFGDMMFAAISTKQGGALCASMLEGDPLEDFCDTGLNSYLRVYAILLGDFELVDFRVSNAMLIIFVLFTFFGVIVLLNTLIALVSNSFEDTKVKSELIFSRSRAFFVAKNKALEAILRPGSNKPVAGSVYLGRFVRWVVVLVIVCTSAFIQVHLVQEIINKSDSTLDNAEKVLTLSFVCFLALLMAFALWIVLVFFLEGLSHHELWMQLGVLQSSRGGPKQRPSSAIAHYVLGLKRKQHESEPHHKISAQDEEWETRAYQLEQMVRRVVAEAKQETIGKSGMVPNLGSELKRGGAL